MSDSSVGYATRSKAKPRDELRPRGVHANGFRWGPRTSFGALPKAETNLPVLVAGQSLTLAGYELLDALGAFVSWHECILDAVDALKAHRGPGKVVRCCDRALMKHRAPHKVCP